MMYECELVEFLDLEYDKFKKFNQSTDLVITLGSYLIIKRRLKIFPKYIYNTHRIALSDSYAADFVNKILNLYESILDNVNDSFGKFFLNFIESNNYDFDWTWN